MPSPEPKKRRLDDLLVEWLPGSPDLHVFWGNSSKVEWLEENLDAQGKPFFILHPNLGFVTPYKSPIVVLDEYESMWNALMHMHNRTPYPPSRLFFVGHPGTGKTMFIYYAMARACHEKIPFILASMSPNKAMFYLDMENEPREIDASDLKSLSRASLRPFILFDAEAGSLSTNYSLDTPLCAAFLTSPQVSRWRSASKDRHTLFFHVNLPTWQDLNRIARVTANLPNKLDLDLLPFVGPSVRQLMAGKSLELIEHEYTQIAIILAKDSQELNAALRGIPMDNDDQRSGFHCFFFMEPPIKTFPVLPSQPRLQMLFEPSHKIVTDWQFHILRRALWEQLMENGDVLLNAISRNSTVYGFAFEGIILDRIRLGQLQGQESHSSLACVNILRDLQEVQPGYTLALPPLDCRDPPLDPAASYFVPVVPGFPTIDAAIITPQEVILFQLTVSREHSIKPQGIRRIQQLVMGSRTGGGSRAWTFIFVVPNEAHGIKLVKARATSTAVTATKKDLKIELSVKFLCVPEERKIEPEKVFSQYMENLSTVDEEDSCKEDPSLHAPKEPGVELPG